MKQTNYAKQATFKQSRPNTNTRVAEAVRLVWFLVRPPFNEIIIIFKFAEIIYIKRIFGVDLLIILMEKVASIFTVRTYLQQGANEEQVLMN